MEDSFLYKVATMEHNAAVYTLVERPDTICYLEAENNVTHLYLENDTRFTINANLRELEDKLPPNQFLYCGEQYLINSEKIIEVWATTFPLFVIRNSYIIPIPSKELSKVLAFFNNDSIQIKNRPKVITFQ
jgi:hypothetical protein